MAKRQEIPDILGPARQQVSVLDDVLSGKPLGTWPKEVDYPIEKIIIGKRLRPVKDVTELAASMKEQGLLQRIVLLPDGTLVVGGHRVAAAKLLGWTTIPARIAELDEVDAELAEIDENLYRRELTVLEQAEHLQRRMELLEIKGQRAKAGDNQHSDATTTAAVAESIGISERSAQQRLQIARGLTQEARDALRDTELAESTTKLLELAKQPQQYQVAIIGKMVSDGYQSVEMAALAVMPRPSAGAPRNDLGDALTEEFLSRYWSKTELQRFASGTIEECRRTIVETQRGAATGTWRYESNAGKVRAWHKSMGESYWDREADAVFTFDRFAKMTVDLALRLYPAQPEEPTISLNELEVVDSVTVRVDDGGKLLMDWDDDDWAAYNRKLEQRQAAAVVASSATGSRQQGAALTTCRICHRPLSDPASAANGIGPCCAGKVITAAGSGTADDDDDQPLQLATVEDDDENWRIDDIIERLKSALGCLGDYEEVTGIHSHSEPLRSAIAPMLRVLESNRI